MALLEQLKKDAPKAFNRNVRPICGEYYGPEGECCVMMALFLKEEKKRPTEMWVVDDWFGRKYEMAREEVAAFAAGYDDLTMPEPYLGSEYQAYMAGKQVRKAIFAEDAE